MARALIVGLRRESEEIDIVRVHDVGLRTMDDPTILQWAADQSRVLITHDIRTVPHFAHQPATRPPQPSRVSRSTASPPETGRRAPPCSSTATSVR